VLYTAVLEGVGPETGFVAEDSRMGLETGTVEVSVTLVPVDDS